MYLHANVGRLVGLYLAVICIQLLFNSLSLSLSLSLFLAPFDVITAMIALIALQTLYDDCWYAVGN